ncbi:MAG: hypothetical protein VXZ27_11260, partial [SAR324 cluster bacterium]|nr:hypothetical protein [SAR324 cluster bacterium]
SFNSAAQISFRADMGKLVDAIIHDITHNGNKETRDDVLRYFTGANLKNARLNKSQFCRTKTSVGMMNPNCRD